MKLEYLAVMNLLNLNRIFLIALCSIISFPSLGQTNCSHKHSHKDLYNSNSRCDTLDIVDTHVYLPIPLPLRMLVLIYLLNYRILRLG